jgi:hypothetical protein
MLDLSRIDELRSEIGAEDLGLIIDVYLSEAEEVLDAIQCDTDPGERSRSLHFLRSGALNLGLSAFAGIATESSGTDAMVEVFQATRDALRGLGSIGVAPQTA